jgi:hypothetical protein
VSEFIKDNLGKILVGSFVLMLGLMSVVAKRDKEE